MILIESLLAELKAAEEFESHRIHGYTEILSFPPNLLTDNSRNEVNEALSWSQDRLMNISAAIEGLAFLISHHYPERVQQIAPQIVIDELKLRLESMRLAVGEFESPPLGELIVGEETPI